MIKLIQLLILGHAHEWEIVDKYELKCGKYVGVRLSLQCKTCGTVKKKDLI